MRGDVPKAGYLECIISEDAIDRAQFLVRQLQKVFQQTQFIHHLQRRGMDGVAAEVAKEVLVLLQHCNLHASAGQKVAQHHACRPPAHNTTSSFHSFRRHSVLPGSAAVQRSQCL